MKNTDLLKALKIIKDLFQTEVFNCLIDEMIEFNEGKIGQITDTALSCFHDKEATNYRTQLIQFFESDEEALKKLNFIKQTEYRIWLFREDVLCPKFDGGDLAWHNEKSNMYEDEIKIFLRFLRSKSKNRIFWNFARYIPLYDLLLPFIVKKVRKAGVHKDHWFRPLKETGESLTKFE